MITEKKQNELKELIYLELEESPGITMDDLFNKLYPDHVPKYDFDQVFQYVRSGHYQPEAAKPDDNSGQVETPPQAVVPEPAAVPGNARDPETGALDTEEVEA